MRARLGTAAHFCEVVVLKLRTTRQVAAVGNLEKLQTAADALTSKLSALEVTPETSNPKPETLTSKLSALEVIPFFFITRKPRVE